MTVIFTAKSFLNDKRYDCHLESQQRAINPLSSFQKDGHLHFEETVIHHIKEKSIPSFRKERGESFRNAIYHFEKCIIRHFERAGPYHFKTTVLPMIYPWWIWMTHFEMIGDLSFGNDTDFEYSHKNGLCLRVQTVIVFLKLILDSHNL